MFLRKLEAQDGEKTLELLYKLDNETKFMLYEPGERKTNPEEMSARIGAINDSGGLITGVEEEGNIVGVVFAQRGHANRIRHSAYIVLGVLKSAAGKGIGTALLGSVEAWARLNDVTKLELTVMMHNERAIELYNRVGYEVEGIKRASVIVEGQMYDEYYMGKVL